MRWRTLFGLASICAWASWPAIAASPQSPNIVFILADDLGWRDVGCFGSTFHQTPHIDALARRGMRFTQAYAANPLCSPTRASIVTGLYPARVGITAPACHVAEEKLEGRIVAKGPPQNRALHADSATRLKTDYVTIAEVLKGAGYRTGHFGKWHLGPEPFSPLQQGFDVDVPHWPGPGPAGAYLAPWKSPKFAMSAKPGEHVEDLLVKEAVGFIHANKDRPFLMHYWAFSVHSPFQSKPELIAKYQALAERLPAGAPQRNPLYAAMVECLDNAVGQLIRAVDDAGIADRTAIIFFSDNGGVNWNAMGMKKKGGGFGEGTEQASPFADIPPTSNAPLRGGKASIYEGGTREPCIVIWPGVTKPGTRSDAIIQSVDFFPTLLEMCGVDKPPGLKLDGASFASALHGRPHDRGATFCHFPHYTPASGAIPCTWVRSGEWKLLRLFADNEDQTDRFELYNLIEDIGESKDLARQHPERVRQLNALIDGFLKDTGAPVPRANPGYNKKASAATIRGWTGNDDLAIEVKDRSLRLQSTGKDPYMQSRDGAVEKGPVTVEFKMKSSMAGPGQVFWSKGPLSFKGRHVAFSPIHDGQWHEYSVPLQIPNGLDALRIDPATGPGEAEIEWIRLKGADGTIAHEWRF